MKLSSCPIFLFFIVNLFNLALSVKKEYEDVPPPPGFAPFPQHTVPTSSITSNPQRNVQQGVNVQRVFAPVPLRTVRPAPSNQTKQGTLVQKPYYKPVFLPNRQQELKSNDKKIQTLYDGKDQAESFDYFRRSKEIDFGGQSDAEPGRMLSFNGQLQPGLSNQLQPWEFTHQPSYQSRATYQHKPLLTNHQQTWGYSKHQLQAAARAHSNVPPSYVLAPNDSQPGHFGTLISQDQDVPGYHSIGRQG